MKISASAIAAGTALVAACAILIFLVLAIPQNAAGIRAVDIPFKENGYSGFKSQVIRSQRELNGFLAQISRQEDSWNERDEFIRGVRKAKVDFAKEVLVLLRHTQGSGSIEVQFSRPHVTAKTMTCDVVTRTPGICTCDMAYYCVAYAVATEHVDNVEVRVDGKRSAALKTKAE